MEKKRLKGLIICGILFLFYGFFGSIGSFQSILKEGINLYTLIGGLFSILFLSSGIGILMLKEWARILLLWAFIPAFAFDFFVAIFIEMPKHAQKMGLKDFPSQMMKNQIFLILGVLLVMWLLIKYYLSHPKVKEQFVEEYRHKEDKKRLAKYAGLILSIVVIFGIIITVDFLQKWTGRSGPVMYKQSPGFFSPETLASMDKTKIKKITWTHNNKTIDITDIHYDTLSSKISKLKYATNVGRRGDKFIEKGSLHIQVSSSDPMVIDICTRSSIAPNIVARFKRRTEKGGRWHEYYYGYYSCNQLYDWIVAEVEAE